MQTILNPTAHRLLFLPRLSPEGPSSASLVENDRRRTVWLRVNHIYKYITMATSNKDGAVVKDILIIVGLVMVQLAAAGYMVLLAPILSLGFNPLFLVTFGSLTTSVFVLPFAFAFEKKKWPSRLTLTLMIRFVLIALGGVTTFQALMLVGVKKTSPSIASAMPNLGPGIIFVIAALLRFEKVDMRCLYSRAKILGTFICLIGTVAMGIMQSPSMPPPNPSERTPTLGEGLLDNNYEDWFVGCFCLLAAVLTLSCTTVLQAATLIDFPAPFTLCSITSLIGSLLTASTQIVIEGKINIGTPVIKLTSIVAMVLMGGIVGAVCVAFQTWAVQMKGPVLVSMFSPVQAVFSCILSAILLGQMIRIGSLVGMLSMFCGLYMVLWAKKKEGSFLSDRESRASPGVHQDIEKPLLS